MLPGSTRQKIGGMIDEKEVVAMSSSAEYVPVPRSSPHVPAEEQARRQGVAPIVSVDELAYPGVWESDDELDEFLADLYASRRANFS